jgi:hypothetical protein
MGKRLAVMQPTFLPWLGYFALMDAVDVFVLLDDVQFSKQSWQSRNRIKGSNGPVMLSLPVSRAQSKPLIMDTELAATGFERKLMATIRGCLGKAPHFAKVDALLDQAFQKAGGKLAALNTWIIREMAALTGIDTPVTLASETGVPGGEKSDRLLALTRSASATTYVSPPGSFAYLDAANPFPGSGIELRYFAYEHPEYPQAFGPFTSHMAAIDALAQVGPEGFLELARSGIRPPLTHDALKEMSHD